MPLVNAGNADDQYDDLDACSIGTGTTQYCSTGYMSSRPDMQMSSSIPNATNTSEESTSDRSRDPTLNAGPPSLAVMPARDSHAENMDGLAEDLDAYGVRNAFVSWLAQSSDDFCEPDISSTPTFTSSTPTFTSKYSRQFRLDLDHMIDEMLERPLANERSPAIQTRRMVGCP